jgi:hypothetical protein
MGHIREELVAITEEMGSFPFASLVLCLVFCVTVRVGVKLNL